MGILTAAKRVLVGRPIHSKHAHHERLTKIFALPVFASDALSSVAYATEEMMRIVVLAGYTYLGLTLNISIAIGILLLVVASSYFQTIHEYPMGGGSYRVSTDNLGSWAGRIAGASLLIDYVLTVAVSVSAGILAIVSLVPATQPYVIELGVLAVATVAVLNLRGAKESGLVFAIPTYSFVVAIFGMILAGLYRGLILREPSVVHVAPIDYKAFEPWGTFVLLRTFAAGCTALTGVEAISDGVQAFKAPESKNAATTLVWMAIILVSMFLGTSWLAGHFGIAPMPLEASGFKTVVAQICEKLFGVGWFFGALQIATALILILAANTAFADFPRLSSFIARDNFLPRQLTSVGDRLVFQNGIILLAVLAIALIILFKGDTHALIPLYAVGVFTSFTLSQAGMVRLLSRKKQPLKMLVSAIGCASTAIVLGIIFFTKFHEGAWIIAVALAVLLLIFELVNRHYRYLAEQLTPRPADAIPTFKTTVLLLVPRLHRGILQAIGYAQSMTKDVRAIHVTLDPKGTDQIKKDWAQFGADIPLVILDSPYRSLISPVTDYIDQTLEEEPNGMITVIVPQAVPKRWYHSILHNNAALGLKLALASRKNVVVTNVRYFLK